jgi:hypothetical protein
LRPDVSACNRFQCHSADGDSLAAVFFALNKLLGKIPLAVKPFLPQLQRTFARGLADTTSEALRNRAARGLGILITLTPRVDPLIAGRSRLMIITIIQANLYI